MVTIRQGFPRKRHNGRKRAQGPTLAGRALRALLATSLVFSSWSLFVKDESPAAPKTSIYDAIQKARTQLDDDKSKEGAPKPLRLLQQARLDAAKQIIETINQPQPTAPDKAVALSKGDDLPRAVNLARAANRLQARSVRVDLPQLDPPPKLNDAPSEAILALAARHDAALSPTQRSRIADLDRLPAPTSSALAQVVDTFAAFESAAQIALEKERHAAPTGDANPKADSAVTASGSGTAPELASLFVARDQLLVATQQLGMALPATSASTGAMAPVEVPGVVRIELEKGENTYNEDFVLLIDAGGRDTYHNNAGGRHAPPEAIPATSTFPSASSPQTRS